MTLDNYNLFSDEYLNLPFNMPLSPLPKVVSFYKKKKKIN